MIADRGVKSRVRWTDHAPARSVLCMQLLFLFTGEGGRVGRARPTSVRAGSGSVAGGRGWRGNRPSALGRARPAAYGEVGVVAWLWLASGARGSSGALAFKARDR
jgi:hypothetical protein